MSTSDAFTCPKCGAVSHNPNDVKQSYCGACHLFFGLDMGVGSDRSVYTKGGRPLCVWHERAASSVEGPSYFIEGPDCKIYLEPRPPYCDRGEWLALLEAHGALARDIDEQDGWPRYYFDLGRAKLEIEAWMKKRGQWIEPVDGRADTEPQDPAQDAELARFRQDLDRQVAGAGAARDAFHAAFGGKPKR